MKQFNQFLANKQKHIIIKHNQMDLKNSKRNIYMLADYSISNTINEPIMTLFNLNILITTHINYMDLQ